MNWATISRTKPNAIPTLFRDLRVLLVDNDLESLIDIQLVLQWHSYKVTTNISAAVALCILHERKDRFDLVIADTDMPDMNCFEFVSNVQHIKNIPIILMSSDPKKDMVTKAIAKGVCFVLRKPVSSEGLKNVWQHVYLYKKRLQNIRNKNENINSTNADLLEIRCQVSNLSKENKRVEIARRSTLIEPKSKQVRESDHIHNDIEKMPLLKENDKQELKRKRTSEATSISDKETSSKVKPFEGKGKEIKTEEGTLEENYNLRRYPDLRLKFEEVINTPDKKGLCIEAERLVHMTRAPKIEEVNDQFEGKLISFQTRSDVGNEASRVGEKSANCHPGIPSISETKHSRPDSHKQLGQSLEKDANHEVTDSGQVYMKLTNGFQETNIKKEKNLSEDYSPEQFKLPLVPTGKKKKPNQPQSTSDMAVEVVQIKKENVKFNVEPTASDRIGSYSGGNSPPMEKELKL